MLMIFLLCFLLGFLELVFLFKFLTHFQFTFVYGISKGLISLCCIWISSFLSTICWRLSFSFVYSCLPCQRLVFHCRTVLKKSVILVYIQNCATITTINFRTFLSNEKETLYALIHSLVPQILSTLVIIYF